jgi:hypothetical protein
MSNKQPLRHNQVVGEKRPPVLNYQTAQPPVPFPSDEMLNAEPPVPLPPNGIKTRTNWEQPSPSQMTAQTQTGQMPNQAGMTQGQTDIKAGVEASPLYYYEQQQAKVATTDLDIANSPVSSSENSEQPIVGLEPSPLAAMQPENPAPIMESNNSVDEYPKLNEIPAKDVEIKEVFADAKSDAKTFSSQEQAAQTTQNTSQLNNSQPAAFEELTLDEFLAKESVKEAEKSIETKQPEPAEQKPSEPVTKSADSVPLENIDFSKQPIQINQEAAVSESAAMSPSPLEQTPPAKIEPFVNDESKAEIEKEMQQQAPAQAPAPTLEPQVVEVPTAPVVAAPRNQRIYTSAGPIELNPPAMQRELGKSRYYNRRHIGN